MLIVSILLFITIGLLILETWVLKRSVKNLQLRIHVNGTRGKSSVTEYIAAGLCYAEPSVMAKITGVIPTIILNGERKIIKREGVARVQEQVDTIRLASRKKVKNLVLECMSISPELQRLESGLFKPHIYVITNIKDDHREEMGKSLEEQADSICSAIPESCIVITNEKHFLPKILDIATKKKTKVIVAEGLIEELASKLPNGVFEENVSLALSVCKVAGISHELATKGIIDYVMRIKSPLTPLVYGGKEILFLNAFTVNDVDSTAYFIDYWQKIIGKHLKITLLFNTRADRPLRSDLFAKWIASIPLLENVILTGTHSERAKHSLVKAGVDDKRIQTWNQKVLSNVKGNLFASVADKSLVIGIGNIAGNGFLIVNELS